MFACLGAIEKRCGGKCFSALTRRRRLGGSISDRTLRPILSSRITTKMPPVSFSSSTLKADDIAKLLPPRFLRESDANNYDAVTMQRNDVPFDADNGKPLPIHKKESKYEMKSCNLEGDVLSVEWEDERKSSYSASWIQATADKWHGKEDSKTPRILWSRMTEEKVRNSPCLSIAFSELLETNGMEKALTALYQFGFVLVTNTPIDDDGQGIAALASAVSGGSIKEAASSSLLAHYRSGGTDIVLPHGTEGPLRTLYGGSVWSTTSSGQADGASVADSAYGKGSLPLHTDMTYHRDPPGLQIFTMVQPALEGGESVFGDGFAAADFLKRHHPDAFLTLTSVKRTYRCIDEATGWHLEAKGPVISTTSGSVVTSIRHNDLDRLPDLPPCGSSREEANEFYEKLADAHEKWNAVLSRDEFRLVMSLRPGETAVVANQRCFHARYSFRTDDSCPRTVMGCYVSQDELNSRFRRMGFRVFT